MLSDPSAHSPEALWLKPRSVIFSFTPLHLVRRYFRYCHLKNEDKQTQNPNNYHSISFKPIVYKVMESIIAEEMPEILLSHFILKCNTATTTYCTISNWTSALDASDSVIFLLLDYSKAFDMVSKRRLFADNTSSVLIDFRLSGKT